MNRENRTSFKFDNKELAKEFYETVTNRFGRRRGGVEDALNEAVSMWVQRYALPKPRAAAK